MSYTDRKANPTWSIGDKKAQNRRWYLKHRESILRRTNANKKTTWYHGTDEASAMDILAHGFNHTHNWFAVNPDNARAVGGPVVLAVEFDKRSIPPPDEDGQRWQMCVHRSIPPEKVRRI